MVHKQEQKESKSASKTKQLENSKTQTNTKDSFGGMKKGFLFGGASKPKAQNETKTNPHDKAKTSMPGRQRCKPELKEPQSLEEIPFITKKEDNKNERFKFSEVQEAMEKTNAKLMGNKGTTMFLLINTLGARQSIDREPFFLPNLQSKKTVQLCLQYNSFENTVGKGEIARNEQFLLFPQCFPTIWKTSCHFPQI